MRRFLLLATMVGLLGACGSSGPTKLPEAQVKGPETPALRILSPQAGDTVTAPVPVSYAVTGYQAGLALAAFPGDTSGYRADLPLAAASGTVLLDDKAFSGKRTLTFALEGSDHTLVPGSSARVSLADVVIEGGRDASAPTTAAGASTATTSASASSPASTAGASSSPTTTLVTSSPVSGPPPSAAPGVALSILSPAPNDVLGASVPITYQVVGFQPGMILAVYPAASTSGFRIDFPLSSASGSVTLENKAFSGRRDLTFSVIAPDGTVSSPVTVPNVVIQGGK